MHCPDSADYVPWYLAQANIWPAGQPCTVVGFQGVDHARHLWSTYRAQGRAAPERALVPRCCTLTHGQEHEAIVQAAMDVEVTVTDGSVALSAWWHVARWRAPCMRVLHGQTTRHACVLIDMLRVACCRSNPLASMPA